MGMVLLALGVTWFLNSDDMDAFMWRIGRGHKDFDATKFALRKSGWRTWRDEAKVRKARKSAAQNSPKVSS